jgi:hypothetical protein
MYRAQRLAEFALYDSDPHLVDSELDHYLSITAEDIRRAAGRYLDVENRVVLDIVPVATAEQGEETAAAASPQSPADPNQPASPPPQVPDVPPAEPPSPVKAEVPELKPSSSPQQPKDPADVPPQTKPGSGPLHP